MWSQMRRYAEQTDIMELSWRKKIDYHDKWVLTNGAEKLLD